jgi:hypothetical protein
MHCDVKTARRAERSADVTGGWLHRFLRRPVRRQDPKVARLKNSWLEPDHRTAVVLARLADEMTLPAGSVLEAGRFSYVGLDDAHRDLVVTIGTPPTTLESAATVLILTTPDLDRIRDDVPGLASARPGPVQARSAPAVAVEPSARCVGVAVSIP